MKVDRYCCTALALAAAFAVSSCGPSSRASELDDEDGEFRKVVNVEVSTVARTGFTRYIRLTGEVEAMNDVRVSAEETGVIERFYKEKGDYVRKGTPIAKIRDRVLRAQVREAAAAAKLAAERYERQRRLWEDERIGSEITYLEAKYEAELQAARHDNLKARLERTLIVAPISGILDDRYVDPGEMVAVGAGVARIVEIDRLKVSGGVAERLAPVVHLGDTARIRLDVLPDDEFIGVIGFVGSVVDERNRTFPIEIMLENPGRVIKPHMVVNVEIAGNRLHGVVVVPQAAVMRTEDGYQVFVAVEVDGDLVAEPRLVRLGPLYANQVVVEEGLDEGDRLIVRGQQLVEAGDRVRIVNE